MMLPTKVNGCSGWYVSIINFVHAILYYMNCSGFLGLAELFLYHG